MTIFSLDNEALKNVSEDNCLYSKNNDKQWEWKCKFFQLQPLITNLILPNENNKNSPKT